MGYVIALGYCICCRRLFAFNPHRVPSVRVNGFREPICRSCVEQVNPLREEKGLEPIIIFDDSYEPMQEEQL
jgi:hypothetical protein